MDGPPGGRAAPSERGGSRGARTPPDNFAPASIVISATLYKKLNYNLEKDLEPIAVAASSIAARSAGVSTQRAPA